ncbi:FkbM family methyltransferase [Stappia indica]|uniref:FkbM family methyltransferase n=1 Tax=Stappia indica TaxID=538381 RepID=UPI001CD604BD|nr:FkbM family methyltransferase [Stappia indica]MCA1298590.1 FkbM family methyltransferase [Stappia indica]
MGTAKEQPALVDQYSERGAVFDFLDPDGSVPAETLPGHAYEPTTTTILDALMKKVAAPVLLDIGAHYGYFTCLMSQLYPHADIHAFEPGAVQFDVLQQNLALNRLPARLHKVALSDSNGTVSFTDRTMRAKDGFPTETVEAARWDDYAAREDIDANIAKIDVHGAEGKVLAGMAETLGRQIRHVLVEVHADDLLVDYSHDQILAMLRDAGMTIYECLDFRTCEQPHFHPMSDDDRKSFADPEQWTAKQIKYERLIYATTDSQIWE